MAGELKAPPAPASIEDTGLSPDALTQLLIKSLYTGEASGVALAERICLSYAVFEPLVEHARVEKLIEVRGAAGSGTAGFRYALTDLGRDRAQQFLEANQYMGPAPVPLSAYVRQMKATSNVNTCAKRSRTSSWTTSCSTSSVRR